MPTFNVGQHGTVLVVVPGSLRSTGLRQRTTGTSPPEWTPPRHALHRLSSLLFHVINHPVEVRGGLTKYLPVACTAPGRSLTRSLGFVRQFLPPIPCAPLRGKPARARFPLALPLTRQPALLVLILHCRVQPPEGTHAPLRDDSSPAHETKLLRSLGSKPVCIIEHITSRLAHYVPQRTDRFIDSTEDSLKANRRFSGHIDTCLVAFSAVRTS